MIGIDPGVSTGYAEWDREAKALRCIKTVRIDEALTGVLALWAYGELHSVTFEDARLRTWFGSADARQAKSGPGIREGIGSVKRDCTIWAEFLGAHGIPFRAMKPAAGSTKWGAEQFKRVTGWDGRTSEHGRDAALLVFGR